MFVYLKILTGYPVTSGNSISKVPDKPGKPLTTAPKSMSNPPSGHFPYIKMITRLMAQKSTH